MKRAALAAALLLLSGCESGHGHPRASASGPFAAARWPAGSVRAGMLLHDDGRHLWSYRLDGKRRLLWRHRAIRGAVVAASPDGRQLAYIVGAPGGRQFLYLLRQNGTVRLADTLGEGWFQHAVFLRHGLFWSRSDAGGGATIDLRVLRRRRAATVHVTLRIGEFPAALAGYPGSPLFTLTLGRRVQPPRPALMLLLDPSRWKDPGRFGELLPLRDVDNQHGVAWLSPTSFVFFVGGQLRLFTEACAWRGSKVVYSGRGVDSHLVDEGVWPLVPVGRQEVLVMPELPAPARRDEGAVMQANDRPLHWAVLHLRARRLARTRLVFSETGWVYVQPDRPFRGATSGGCPGFSEPPS
ncbi:MAG: hypothetical protein ACXVRE_02040 [Gaiellaceae bacterium]